ncbi:MAG: hypothetical protein SFH39_13495 [Candidatus Magnetobacterium sp. LHC-1]
MKTVDVVDSQAWFWTEEVQESLRKAEENYTSGNFKSYTNVEELITDLRGNNNDRA